jgi:hypothetical protein
LNYIHIRPLRRTDFLLWKRYPFMTFDTAAATVNMSISQKLARVKL